MTIHGKHYHLMLATLAHLPQITAIYNQNTGIANANFESVDVANRQRWFESHDDTRPIVVIKDDECVVGWASLSDLYDRPAYMYSVEISIYIDKNYHGLGLGSLLLYDMLERAKTLDIINVLALIFGHNVSSLFLFAKFGFEQWGILPKTCLSQGQLVDVMILGKKIKSCIHIDR